MPQLFKFWKSGFFLSLIAGFFLIVAVANPSVAATLTGANDFIESLELETIGVEHRISFVIPNNGHSLLPGEYILIEMPDYTNITAPTDGSGWSGTPVFGVNGTTAYVTGVSAFPGTGITVSGITATNPADPADFPITIKIAADINGTVVFDSVLVQPERITGSVTTSVTILPEVITTEIDLKGFAFPNSFITIRIDGAVVATGSADGNGKFSINLPGLTPNQNILISISAEDSLGLQSNPIGLSIFTIPNAMITIENIVIPVTINLDKTSIVQGESLQIFGSAYPNTNVTVFIDQPPLLSKNVLSDAVGNWSWDLTPSEYGNITGLHEVYAVQIVTGGFISNISKVLGFTISLCQPGDPGCPLPTPVSTQIPEVVVSPGLTSVPSPTVTITPTPTPLLQIVTPTTSVVAPDITLVPTDPPREQEGFIERAGNFLNRANETIIEAREQLREIVPETAQVVGYIPAATAILTTVYSYPRFFIFALAWVRDRKKYNPWGIVYNKLNNAPVPFATVRVYEGDKFIKEQVTNLEGKYGIPQSKGLYRLQVAHPDFQAGEISVRFSEQEKLINSSIGLMPRDSELDAKSLQRERLKQKLRENFRKLNNWIFNIGFVVTLVITFIYTNLVNLLILGFYLFQIGLYFFQHVYHKRSWGVVVDTLRKEGVKQAFVRIFSIKDKVQIDVQLTDEKGRFFLPLRKGNYWLLVDAPGYEFPSSQEDPRDVIASEAGNKFIKIESLGLKGVTRRVPIDPVSGESLESQIGEDIPAGGGRIASPFG